MRNRTEFIAWYNNWFEVEVNKYLDHNDIFIHIYPLLITYYEEYRDIWHKDYIIWKLSQ